jgi:hypothetical protein
VSAAAFEANRRRECRKRLPADVVGQDRSKNGLAWPVSSNHSVLLGAYRWAERRWNVRRTSALNRLSAFSVPIRSKINVVGGEPAAFFCDVPEVNVPITAASGKMPKKEAQLTSALMTLDFQGVRRF